MHIILTWCVTSQLIMQQMLSQPITQQPIEPFLQQMAAPTHKNPVMHLLSQLHQVRYWVQTHYSLFVCFLCNSPQWARAFSFTRFLNLTHNDGPQSVGLLWTSDQLVTQTSTDNTQHSQQTDIHASGGIRTHNLSRCTAADLRLRLRSHWDRQTHYNSC